MMIPPRCRNLEFFETDDDNETRVLSPPDSGNTENICRVESETFLEDAILISDRRQIGGLEVQVKAAIVERKTRTTRR